MDNTTRRDSTRRDNKVRDKIGKNLLDKALKGSLAHFFIVNPPGRAKDAKAALRNWCESLVGSYFEACSKRAKNLKNVEDALIIDDEMLAKKYYDQAFVSQITQFLSHRPVIGDRKFIIIEDMDKMSPIHCNKLLKIFEEPPVNATIFALNPSGSKPMQTIASRAVSLRAPIPVQKELLELNNWNKKLERKNLHQFCEYFKTRREEERDFARALTDNIGESAGKSLLNKTQKYLEIHIEDDSYNHNSYARLTLLREIYLELAAPGRS